MDKLIDQIAAAAQIKIAAVKKGWPKGAVHPDVNEQFVRAEVDARKGEVIEAAIAAALAEFAPAAKPAAKPAGKK